MSRGKTVRARPALALPHPVAVTPSELLVADGAAARRPRRRIGDVAAVVDDGLPRLHVGRRQGLALEGVTCRHHHLAAELFNRMAGIRLVHVPYKGAAPALADVMSGQVQIIFPALPTTLAQIRSGRLRALGVTSTRRAASLPDVPTIAEAGVAGYDAANWYALLAPAHTPKAFIATLNAGIVQALRSTEISEALLRQGADAIPSTPAECERYLTSEIAKWRTVIGDAGIRAE